MRTPRQAFLESPQKEEFKRMAETMTMDAATEYALLTYLDEMPVETDPNAAWGAYCKTVGAREVLAILKTIHLPQTQPKEYRPPQLKRV